MDYYNVEMLLYWHNVEIDRKTELEVDRKIEQFFTRNLYFVTIMHIEHHCPDTRQNCKKTKNTFLILPNNTLISVTLDRNKNKCIFCDVFSTGSHIFQWILVQPCISYKLKTKVKLHYAVQLCLNSKKNYDFLKLHNKLTEENRCPW